MPNYVNGTIQWGFFTNMVMAVPSGIVAGDILVVATGRDRSGSGTLPAGWNEVTDSPFGFSRFAYRVVDGSEAATYQFGNNGASWVGAMLAYRGVTIGNAGNFNSTTTSVIRAPSKNAAAAGALLVNFWHQSTASAAWLAADHITVVVEVWQ